MQKKQKKLNDHQYLKPLISTPRCCNLLTILVLYFDLRPGPKILFQGNTPEGSDTFQRPVIERDQVGGLRRPLGFHLYLRRSSRRIQMGQGIAAPLCYILTFDPAPKILFLGDTPEGSDTFQWPVIERDRVGGLRLMIWDKVKVPLCH